MDEGFLEIRLVFLVRGWNLPTNQDVTVSAGVVATFTAVYTKIVPNGSLARVRRQRGANQFGVAVGEDVAVRVGGRCPRAFSVAKR